MTIDSKYSVLDIQISLTGLPYWQQVFIFMSVFIMFINLTSCLLNNIYVRDKQK